MKKRYLVYSLLPAMALALTGAGIASAHGWFGGNATPEETVSRQTEMFQHQADMLGVTVDEVKDAWAQGKTLPELAEEKGISEEDLRAKMQEQRKARMQEHLQALVDQGVITQAQADQRKAWMEQKIENSAGMMGKGFGVRGMHHGMVGMGF